MKENILLVEDEEALRMVLGDRLRQEGYVVDSASDGETGFQKATSLPFDLMILDIMLPGRNGLDLSRDLPIAGLSTPILLLTACPEAAVKLPGLEVGADYLITKPFDMQELSARVEALLRSSPGNRSSDLSAAFPRSATMQISEDPGTAPAVGQESLTYVFTSQNSKLPEELRKRVSVQKDSPLPLVEVIPHLRQMLDEEQQSPQTPRNTAFLNVAEGIIQFFEDFFGEIRSAKRRC